EVPAPLHASGYRSYQLGVPVAELLSRRTVDQLKQLGSALGLSLSGRKDQRVDQLLAFFRDPDKLRTLLADAPAETAELLAECAWHGPEIEYYPGYAFYGRDPQPVLPATWAVN